MLRQVQDETMQAGGRADEAPDPAVMTQVLRDLLKHTPTVEVRVLGEKRRPKKLWVTAQSVEDAARWAADRNAEGYAVYTTFNQIERPRSGSAADADVSRRVWLLIDIDTQRPKGMSATEEQRRRADETARAVRNYLEEQWKTGPGRVHDSGNGVHLFYRVDLPADDGKLVNRLLQGLAAKFPTDQVKIDTSVSNASRIVRLPGTVNVKGDDHRTCQVVETNDGAAVVPEEQVRTTADALTPPRAVPKTKRQAAKTAVSPVVPKGPWATVPPAEREERCRSYLAAIPDEDLPRSGRNGHDSTFRVASVIANDFALSKDRDACLRLLRAFNDRLRGVGDEWTDDELAHKLDDAIGRVGTEPEYSVGCKLGEAGPPMAWDNPVRLAGEFRRRHTYKFVKDTIYHYEGAAYSVASSESLDAAVHKLIRAEAEREYRRREREAGGRIAELEGKIGEVKVLKGDTRKLEIELSRLRQSAPAGVPKFGRSLVANVVAEVKTDGHLSDDTELDHWTTSGTSPPVLSVANGLLELTTRELKPHDPAWFSTVTLPVRYDADAPPPAKWLVFLQEVMEGDAERIAVIQEVFGACLDRDGPGKWFAAFVGSGDNGKSVALLVLKELLGRANCSAVQLNELMNNRFAAFSLFGKLANLIGDQGYMNSEDEGKLKTLTGGDMMPFEQKGRDTIFAVNKAKIVFGCNTMPTFGDKSEAVWNRLVAVPFDYTVPADRKDPAMLTPEFWAAELPGILNWALDGRDRFESQKGRFTKSKKCDDLKRVNRLDSNPAKRFLEEESDCVDTGSDDDYVDPKKLYRAYSEWCKASGVTKPLTDRRFNREVRSTFPKLEGPTNKRIGVNSPRVWVGLKRNSPWPWEGRESPEVSAASTLTVCETGWGHRLPG